ncbi:MAG: hypothetical protein DVB26_05900 [Verrucomicrobia bacterium]|nr:MAG: hypothetical protein DVB26_05900 [Verrucomicrobiota bacterium]
MKRTGLIVWMTSLLAMAASSAVAANRKSNRTPTGPPSAVYAKYDVDQNRKINVEEGEAVRKDYAKTPSDPLLKPYDTNHDGVMSDAEIMAIPATARAAALLKKPK